MGRIQSIRVVRTENWKRLPDRLRRRPRMEELKRKFVPQQHLLGINPPMHGNRELIRDIFEQFSSPHFGRRTRNF